MRRILCLFLLSILALACDAMAGEPRLTLLFNGQTEAEVRPCPT